MQQRMEDKTVAISVAGTRIGARLLRDLARSYLNLDRRTRAPAHEPGAKKDPVPVLHPQGQRRAGDLLHQHAKDCTPGSGPDRACRTGPLRTDDVDTDEEIRTVRGRVIAPLPVVFDRNELAPFETASARNGVSFSFRSSDDGRVCLFLRAKDECAIRAAFSDYLATPLLDRPYIAERLREKTPVGRLPQNKESPALGSPVSSPALPARTVTPPVRTR